MAAVGEAKFLVKLMTEHAVAPVRGSALAAGYDLSRLAFSCVVILCLAALGSPSR